LPATDGRIDKDRKGPDLDDRALHFSITPNRATDSGKISFFPLATARPLTILSWPEALNASGLRPIPLK
jgi:hypothetical protein